MVPSSYSPKSLTKIDAIVLTLQYHI
uniref:Uncharacterized protein n=1 Tax=Physcomitrium patens TaxID=3218 RepID=A0A2K1JKL4_PHYPA|nr:hypothetical protein PHYPA_016910 [Physcomitrium patens]